VSQIIIAALRLENFNRAWGYGHSLYCIDLVSSKAASVFIINLLTYLLISFRMYPRQFRLPTICGTLPLSTYLPVSWAWQPMGCLSLWFL